MSNDAYLEHHGIKGQRWGVRRFQNKDGSLTLLGRKKRKQEDTVEKKEETTEERRARVLKSTDAKEIYKNRDVLSTAEINERLNRIDTEARLSKVAESTQKSGMDYINSRMRKTTDTINTAKNFFKSVDESYSTLSNSSIGKTISKKLGLEPPKKEFNIEEFWKNRNKKSTQEIMDANKRLTAEKLIEAELERRRKGKKD